MKQWKVLALSLVAAMVVMSGCGDKKSESVAHEAAPKAEVKPAAEAPKSAPEAAAPAPAKEVKEEAPAQAAEKEAPAAEAPAKEEVAKKVEQIADKVAQGEAEGAAAPVQEKVEEAKKSVDAAVLFAKCAGCHGMKGEKHALGQSNVIAGQSKAELIEKIEGYQKGTYGGAMKSLMQGQVKNLTPEEVDALADYISKL
ncbi:c-type cytochrome [Hydrogenimonas sp.]